MSSSLVSLASLLNAFEPSAPEVRVAAVIQQGGKLLLLEREKDGERYWVLPGDRLRPRETLEAALRRALRAELRLDARVGPLLIVCESLAPERQVVNLIYQARVGGATRLPLSALEPSVRLDWVDSTMLGVLDLRPPIGAALMEVTAEGFSGPVKLLGDTWQARPRRRSPRRGIEVRGPRAPAIPAR